MSTTTEAVGEGARPAHEFSHKWMATITVTLGMIATLVESEEILAIWQS